MCAVHRDAQPLQRFYKAYFALPPRSSWSLTAFHEGRGTGKSTTPGGREKHAYFLELRPEPAFKALGASVRTSKDADCWDGTNLVLSSSISFKVNLLTLMGRS